MCVNLRRCVSYGTKSPGVCRCRRVWTSSDFLRLPPESVPFPFTELLVAKALVRIPHLYSFNINVLCLPLLVIPCRCSADVQLALCDTLYPLQHGTRITFYYFAGIRDQVFGVTFKIGKATWLQFSVCFGNPQEVWVAIPAVVTYCVHSSVLQIT